MNLDHESHGSGCTCIISASTDKVMASKYLEAIFCETLGGEPVQVSPIMRWVAEEGRPRRYDFGIWRGEHCVGVLYITIVGGSAYFSGWLGILHTYAGYDLVQRLEELTCKIEPMRYSAELAFEEGMLFGKWMAGEKVGSRMTIPKAH